MYIEHTLTTQIVCLTGSDLCALSTPAHTHTHTQTHTHQIVSLTGADTGSNRVHLRY